MLTTLKLTPLCSEKWCRWTLSSFCIPPPHSHQELIRRGYDVIAFSREQAGIKGKMGKEDITKV